MPTWLESLLQSGSNVAIVGLFVWYLGRREAALEKSWKSLADLPAVMADLKVFVHELLVAVLREQLPPRDDE